MTLLALPVYILAGIALYVGFYNLVFSRLLPAKAEHRYFAWVCFSAAAYAVFSGRLYESTTYQTSLWAQRGQLSSACLVSASLVLFMRHLSGRAFPRALSFLGAFWLLFAGIVWIDSPLLLNLQNKAPKYESLFGLKFTYLELEPGWLIQGLYISFFAGILSLFWLLYWLARQKQRGLGWPFNLSLSIYLVAAINDILVGAGAINGIYILEYAYVSMLAIMDHFLMRQFVGLWQEEERRNEILEEKVRERMEEVHSLAQDLQQKNLELESMNGHLLELIERDSLTGLYNHGAFQQRLRELLDLAKRQHIPLCVVMIDVDHFKQFNDQNGHQAGDEVLRQVARLIGAAASDSRALSPQFASNDGGVALRAYDVAGRYGGDEFALVLPYCDRVSAQVVLNRLLGGVRALRLLHYPQLRITLSIGGWIQEPGEQAFSAKTAMEKADNALYQAKDEGRNRYVLT